MADLEIDAAEGVIVIRPEAEALIDLNDLRKTVRDSGFTPREVDVNLTGKVEVWRERKTLVVGSERFLLAPTGRIAEIEAIAAANQGSTRISGRVSINDAEGHGAHPPTIEVEEVSAPR